MVILIICNGQFQSLLWFSLGHCLRLSIFAFGWRQCQIDAFFDKMSWARKRQGGWVAWSVILHVHSLWSELVLANVVKFFIIMARLV